MSGFDDHNIGHLSPSSINAYATQPALWVMERLLGHRSQAGAAAARGVAAEEGVNLGLTTDASLEDCVAAALKSYDRAMALNGDPRREDERAKIPGYVEHGLAELRAYGTPSSYQEKVSVELDGVPVPIVGFIDWTYEQHGLLLDMKTAEKHPSTINPAHGRQGALYCAAKHNHAIRFAYTKPSPGRVKDARAVVVYELDADTARQRLEDLRQIAIRMERFLRISKDPHELAGLLVPDYGHFYWNNPTTRAAGQQVFGF